MKSALPVEPVLRLLIAFSRHEAALDWAQETAAHHWGPVALVSQRFDFLETDYYQSTMGTGQRLQIFALADAIDPGQLSQWKRQTGDWEAEYAQAAGHAEPRPLNLDPGYLTLAKFVLASTKDHSHRIYLGQGIFAEVTLFFRSGRWQAHPWTYPNYRREDYQDFLTRCREFFYAQRSKEPRL